MDCIYVFLEINCWEDIIIFLSKEDAINESKKYPNARVEIFKIDQEVGYTPTYNFYKNGELIVNLSQGKKV
jgi:hypothetical protein